MKKPRRTKVVLSRQAVENLRYASKAKRSSTLFSLTEETMALEGGLAWLQGRFAKDPAGGIVCSPGQIRPYIELISEYAERLGKLKRRRLEMLELVEGRKEGKSLAKWARAWKPTNGG